MKNWSYDEELAQRESLLKQRTRRRVKEIFGACLLVAVGGAAGLHPRTVLNIADDTDAEKKVTRNPREEMTVSSAVAILDDLLG